MNDKDILTTLIKKYGVDELKKLIDDIDIRSSFKYSVGEHSIKVKSEKIDSQSPRNSYMIVKRGFGWSDFIKLWNRISTDKRNQFYNYDPDSLESYIKDKKWYILRPTDVKDFKYFICIEEYIIR